MRRSAAVAALFALPPCTSRAQEPGRVYRVAIVAPSGRRTEAFDAFFNELRLNGFIEGQNLNVVVSGFDSRDDQISEVVAKVVAAAPDAVVAQGQAIIALRSAGSALPAVAMSEDMLAEGMVTSLARPGGSTTGISIMSTELDSKRLGLLIEAVPGARKMAAVADSKVSLPGHLQGLQAAARSRGIELVSLAIAKPEEVLPAIDAAKAAGSEAINFLATPLTYIPRKAVFERAEALRLPAIYQWPEMAEEGGFVGYGPRFTQLWRQRARMLVKLLRGAKPADVPVEQPTKFELVVNLKTAKAIGHDIPASLALRADKVIE